MKYEDDEFDYRKSMPKREKKHRKMQHKIQVLRKLKERKHEILYNNRTK